MVKNEKKKKLEEKEEKDGLKEVPGKTKEKLKKIREDIGIQKYLGVFVVGLTMGLLVGAAILSSLFVQEPSAQEQPVLTAEEVGQKAIEWISNFAVQPGTNVELINITEVEGEDIYKLFINISLGNASQVAESYITKDAEYLFPQGIPTGEFLALMEEMEQEEQNEEEEQTGPEVTKSDKPEVELFVMTHCPYGTQAEKGFIPAIKALGDTINAKIRFVHYFMHAPEEDETPKQVCIREEQSD